MLTLTVGTAIDRCYGAVADANNFSNALEHLAHAFDAKGCSFVPSRAGISRLHAPASPLYREFVKDFVGEGWASSDLRAKRGWPRLRRGKPVLLEHDLITDEEREHLPVYRDLYMRHDLYWWSTVSLSVEGDIWALSFLRSHQTGPFQRSEAKGLAALAYDLSRLLQLRLTFARAQTTDLIKALDMTGQSAFVMTSGLAVVAINDAARHVLEPSISFRDGRLIARSHVGWEALSRLRLAFQQRSDADAEPIVLRHAEAMRPVLLDLIRLDALFGNGPCALVVVRDTGARGRTDRRRLKQVFDFSPAELSLAWHLAEGASLDKAATSLGISHETARTQLKALFVKTGCHRQADLLVLLLQVGGRSL